jgi:hypothetical protein
MKALWLTVAAVLLASCGSMGINPQSLKPASTKQTLVMKDALYWEKGPFPVSGNGFRYTLLPGTYAPKYEDATGTYFEGRGRCLQSQLLVSQGSKTESIQPFLYRCGIFVATGAAEQRIQIYFYPLSDVPKSQAARGASDTLVESAISTSSTPLQTSVGTVIGVGVANAIVESGREDLGFFDHQPTGDALRSAISFK